MLAVRDRGEETSVLYDIDTAPSGVKVTCEGALAIVAMVRRRSILVAVAINF